MSKFARAQAGLQTDVTDPDAPISDIQWMPPGPQTPTAYVDGEPKRLSINVTSALALKLNSILQYLRSLAGTGNGDVPFIDFNHEDGAAAGEVLQLYWGGDDPVTGGIRAKVRWSEAGMAAIKGRTYRRFSPQWSLDENDNPAGIGVNLGGLVNRAAFRTIQALAKFSTDVSLEERIALELAKQLGPLADRLERILQSDQPREQNSAGTHPLVVLAKALQKDQGISFDQAVRIVSAKDPSLAVDYQAQIRAGGKPALETKEPHPFIVKASALMRSRGVTFLQAQELAARQDFELYQDFVSHSDRAGLRRQVVSANGKAAEFVRQVEKLEFSGWSTSSAVSWVAASNPEGHQAYLAQAKSSAQLADPHPVPGNDHPYMAAVLKLVNEDNLAPMKAARIVAEKSPELYKTYLADCSAAHCLPQFAFEEFGYEGSQANN